MIDFLMNGSLLMSLLGLLIFLASVSHRAFMNADRRHNFRGSTKALPFAEFRLPDIYLGYYR